MITAHPFAPILSECYEVIERPTPAPEDTITQLSSILERIQDGTLLHNQEYYDKETHCGTAHCVAGWKVIQDRGYSSYEETPSTWELETLFEESFPDVQDWQQTPWLYAELSWQLTLIEAALLFRPMATIPEQLEVLALLKAGLTLIPLR